MLPPRRARAQHMTYFDSEMSLPNGEANPGRRWAGQRFVLHREAEAQWVDARLPGWTARRTGIAGATGGLADVTVLKSAGPGAARFASHDAAILFTFVLEGRLTVDIEGGEEAGSHGVEEGDAFLVPAHGRARYRADGPVELLEVSMPGAGGGGAVTTTIF